MDDPNRCPECDFELMYVRASRVRAVARLGENTEISLHMTDVIVCSRCHWWRPAEATDHPVPWTSEQAHRDRGERLGTPQVG